MHSFFASWTVPALDINIGWDYYYCRDICAGNLAAQIHDVFTTMLDANDIPAYNSSAARSLESVEHCIALNVRVVFPIESFERIDPKNIQRITNALAKIYNVVFEQDTYKDSFSGIVSRGHSISGGLSVYTAFYWYVFLVRGLCDLHTTEKYKNIPKMIKAICYEYEDTDAAHEDEGVEDYLRAWKRAVSRRDLAFAYAIISERGPLDSLEQTKLSINAPRWHIYWYISDKDWKRIGQPVTIRRWLSERGYTL